MRFGALFFGAQSDPESFDYADLVDIARWLDERSFAFISLPERHFDRFGGLFPSPAVLAGGLATVTGRIQLRAGSVVLPLHDVARVVEDWSVVDRLSHGRVALSFGSGWNVNDFVLAPHAYEQRREQTRAATLEVRRLWRERRLRRENGAGEPADLRLYPDPVQPELPVWVTASRSPDTFREAGRADANVLTHLENQDLDGLAERIAVYRAAREQVGLDPSSGIVTVMQHTFVSDDEGTLERVCGQLRDYLARGLDLERAALRSGGSMSGRKAIGAADLDDRATAAVLDNAVRKYTEGLALVGSVGTCVRRAQRLRAAGADELACLLDFVASRETLLAGLPGLAELNDLLSDAGRQQRNREVLARFAAGPGA